MDRSTKILYMCSVVTVCKSSILNGHVIVYWRISSKTLNKISLKKIYRFGSRKTSKKPSHDVLAAAQLKSSPSSRTFRPAFKNLTNCPVIFFRTDKYQQSCDGHKLLNYNDDNVRKMRMVIHYLVSNFSWGCEPVRNSYGPCHSLHFPLAAVSRLLLGCCQL